MCVDYFFDVGVEGWVLCFFDRWKMYIASSAMTNAATQAAYTVKYMFGSRIESGFVVSG